MHARDADQSKVRGLQSRYAAIWADELQRESPGLDRRAAHAAVHATFGLINSTPFSGRLPRTAMVDMLSTMAASALRAGARSGTVLADPA